MKKVIFVATLSGEHRQHGEHVPFLMSSDDVVPH